MANTTETSLLGIVLDSDPNHYYVDDAYSFSNDRTFQSTDNTNQGIYRTLGDVTLGGTPVIFGGEDVTW